jgi:signal transduction histidine kinase
VIGGAVLIVGLLLILAGLAAAWIPGEATFASSGIALAREPGAAGRGPLRLARRARDPLRAFLLSPIHPATWNANIAIGAGFFVGIIAFALLVSLASAGFATLVAGVGVLLIVMVIEGSRVVAAIERRRVAFAGLGPLLAHPYRPLRGGPIDLLRAEFADENRWRDVLYVAVNFPLTIIEFVVVVTIWAIALWLLTMPVWYDATTSASLPDYLGLLAGHDAPLVIARTLVGAALLPVAASVSQLVIALHRAVVAGLLCTSESRELRRQVETLKESRSAVLDVEASELHRIERDLHDGAQQRLVMLNIDLGLASERIDSDPQGAKQLVLEGQEQARQALAELRDLVRGIAPSILLDRGLVPALGSIASRGPVPTVVRSDLPAGQRLPAALERAAYYVATEALANVAKHSGARHGEVRCRREGGRLIVEVWDDGVGGAIVQPGGGLAGLAGRVAGVDGTFSVSSPAGGPTLVRAELPVPDWATAALSA